MILAKIVCQFEVPVPTGCSVCIHGLLAGIIYVKLCFVFCEEKMVYYNMKNVA